MPRRKNNNFNTTASNILIQPELSFTEYDRPDNSRGNVLSRNEKRAYARANFFPFFKGGILASSALWAGVKSGLSPLIFLPATAALFGYGFKSAFDYGQQCAKAFKTLQFYYNDPKKYLELANDLSSNDSQDYVFEGVLAQALFSLNAYNDEHAQTLAKLFEKIELTPDLFDIWHESDNHDRKQDFAAKLSSQVEKVFTRVETKVDSCVSDRNSTLAHMYNSMNMLRNQIGQAPVQHFYQTTSWATQFSEFLGCGSSNIDTEPSRPQYQFS